MPSRFAIALIGFCLTILASVGHAGEVVDRIVATVNKQIILQSDLEDAIRYEAFLANHSLNAISAAERKAALDHLIDQELLLEQMRGSDLVKATEQQVQSQIQDIRKQYEAANEVKWKALLAAHQLTEDVLRRRIAQQLDLSRLVDFHLRPAANISSRSIESYYQQELLPQLHQSGAKDVPLAEVSPKIKELLTQQKITELLVSWLQTLRAASEIRTSSDPKADESLRNE